MRNPEHTHSSLWEPDSYKMKKLKAIFWGIVIVLLVYFIPIVVVRLERKPLYCQYELSGVSPYTYLSFEENKCYTVCPGYEEPKYRKSVFCDIVRSKNLVVGDYVKLEWDGNKHHLWLNGKYKPGNDYANPWKTALAPIIGF